MKMVDEMQDPLRQGMTFRLNRDGSVTTVQGRVRCCRCDEIPEFLFGLESAPICHACQVAIYQVGYAAFVASRETPTYVEPKWWRRPVSPVFMVMGVIAFYWLMGFWSASASIGEALP